GARPDRGAVAPGRPAGRPRPTARTRQAGAPGGGPARQAWGGGRVAAGASDAEADAARGLRAEAHVAERAAGDEELDAVLVGELERGARVERRPDRLPELVRGQRRLDGDLAGDVAHADGDLQGGSLLRRPGPRGY